MLNTYRKIFDLLDRRERLRFMVLMLMILCMGLLDVAGVASILPFLAVLSDPGVISENAMLSLLFDWFGRGDERRFLILLGGLVFTLVVLGLAFKALTLYALTRFSTLRNYSISSRLLRGYLAQPYAWFLQRHSADLGKTVLSEVDQVIGSSIIPAMTLLAHGTVLIALTLLLIAVDPVSTLIAVLLLGGSYVLIFRGVRRLLGRLGKRRVKANRQRYQVASEALGGIKDVKVLGLEAGYLQRFRAPAHAFARTQATGRIISQLPRYVLEAVAFGAMLGFVLMLLVQGDRRLEDLVPILGLFAFAGVRMFPAVQQVYQAVTKMRFGQPALTALHQDMVETRHARVPSQQVPPVRLLRELRLHDVHYSYPQAPRSALAGVTLPIQAHTTVGLVGTTGAGKTTVVDIVLGLLRPTQGSLLVDDVEITSDNLRGWQRSVGYVPQQIFLSDDTVAANIAFGVSPEEIDMDAVQRAARIANLHQFVLEHLPQGYETRVGERGVRLSGGQRQRIGIARALYHDPDVLVLDEATSALDTLTERAVMDAVRNLAGAKTLIMVAHRLSTVEHCDRIFLLDQGRVVGQGSYKELLRTNEHFRQMAEAAA